MTTLFGQHAYNVSSGPLHEGAPPVSAPSSYPVRFIAYYLPQFHPIPVNDQAWGPGFTEWTNTTKALPRYVGHYQPRLPADLGYYDLRSVATLERQADLARRGGVYGFCIHNYWFGGERVLETPLELLLANPHIDLPFCLNWANESWSRRWDGAENELLLEQRFSAADDIAYAESLIPAVEDRRYIRINGRPLIMIYRPAILPEPKATIERWRGVFVKRGLGDPYVVMAEAHGGGDPRPFGIDATAGFPPHGHFDGGDSSWVRRLDYRFRGVAKSYAETADRAVRLSRRDYPYFPGVCPDWDNEARKPGRGVSFYGSTPAVYGRWLRRAADQAMATFDGDERIVFINAWNEWAEGAYLEPDRHFGHAYLNETARILAELGGYDDPPPAAPQGGGSGRYDARRSVRHYVGNRARSAVRKVLDRVRSK